MNLLILKIAKLFTKYNLITIGLVLISLKTSAWDVDLSRRIKNVETNVVDELRWPSSLKPAEELFSETSAQQMFSSVEPAQSIAILQTENGFVPDTIRIRKDGNYKIFVANVNEKFKNASFILDAFGQNHGTYFGKPKSFELAAKVNGVFTFLCPETGAQGKIVVFSDKEPSTPVAVSQAEVKK